MVGYVLSLLFFFSSLLSIYNDGHNNPHICCHVLLFSGRIRGHLRPSTPTAVAVNGRKVAFAWCGIRFIVSFTVIQDNKYNLHTHTHTHLVHVFFPCLHCAMYMGNMHHHHHNLQTYHISAPNPVTSNGSSSSVRSKVDVWSPE